MEKEKYFENLYNMIKKDNDEMKEILKKNNERINELENKIKNLENIINLKIKDKPTPDIVLFEKSTIIKNDFERKLLESFIKENDNSKKNIYPVLLFKATIDGDTPQDFHKKCDYMGATITIVQSDSGRRFGGYTSISWDQSSGWVTKGVNFLFSLDTRKYYKNISGSYPTNHSAQHNPEFGAGHDLTLSTGCLTNSNSYSTKSSYDMDSNYELNGGTQKFKVIDYEVFQI